MYIAISYLDFEDRIRHLIVSNFIIAYLIVITFLSGLQTHLWDRISQYRRFLDNTSVWLSYVLLVSLKCN